MDASVASRSGMDGDQFQTKNAQLKAQGYRLTHLESYLDGGGVRYAALWEKASSGPAQSYYFGLSAEEHQRKVEEFEAQGYRPKTVSVVSDSGL